MLLFTVGSSFLTNGCNPAATKKTTVSRARPLGAVHIPAGTISRAVDGIAAGFPKIRSEHTNGQFCCQEISLKPKYAGPPPHLHKDLDEIMYVLEGSVQVMVGDTVTEVSAGDYHLRPHGIVHTFWNSGTVPARFIDMYPNQDFLSFFESLMRIENDLKEKGLTLLSPEGQDLNNALLKKFGCEIFIDQYPPLLAKYGLKTS
ncbi:hypothetical protein BUE76_09090 [Cnuella takakiae]|nr:hypothetical protein BUE76_09090 [Cnuella takakiae]